ncbi:MAG: deiodinase-like protein [Flavobacteriales bacterium]
MRSIILSGILLVAFTSSAQSGWNPVPHKSDAGLTFRDDLDFYLNGYSKKEIKQMRQQVNIWKMNWDKMLRQAISDVRSYSEGNLNDGRTHAFTLTDTDGQEHTLTDDSGNVRAFMFASITNPPSRMQIPRWNKLKEKYDASQVELFIVYGRELHPGDNKFRDYPQPKTEAEKLGYAQQLAGTTDLPVLVDGLDNRVLNMYGQVPNACYVIDRSGRLVFRGTWADSRKVEMVIDQLLEFYKEKG